MRHSFVKDQDYKGPTTSRSSDMVISLTGQFAHITGPQELRRALKAWGLARDISPRQARFWNESSHAERLTFCRIAARPDYMACYQWEDVEPVDRPKIWSAINAAATWGERLKGRF